MPRPGSIPAIRDRIDRIDKQLVELLNRRARLALAVAAQKRRHRSDIYAPGRESGVLARVAQHNGGPLAAASLRAIFREIISASRGLEVQLRVSYLGPAATWTHLAAQRQFGAAADYVPADTIADIFRDVEAGRAELGVVPVENSTEGMVAHTLDLLVDSSLAICAEVAVHVRHCLLVRRGTALPSIRRVVAHPQALAQCAPARARGVPVVLRAQNVESDLWAAVGGGRPLTGALARIEAGRMAERKRLVIPAAAAETAGLASAYASPDLGRITIAKSGGKVVLRATAWSSEVASRHNDDGTVSLMTIDPQILGLEFVIGSKGGKRTLTTRDGQHVYELVEAAN